jgi:glycosyltransferase involved in cell wall biosynthesis
MEDVERRPRYSVVIPAYKSAAFVEETIDRTAAVLEAEGLDYEIVLVDDGSPDATWPVLERKARENPRVVAIRLMRNYGQHTAVVCGLNNITGDYAVTMDDDLQNPPEEIRKLVDKAAEGDYDLVMGRFQSKKHSLTRRLGSRLVAWLNERVFGKPRDFVVSNFRLIRRDVVDRMCAHRTHFPYVTGLALLYSAHRANVLVDHQPRRDGASGYGLGKILSLVLAILFNYSGFPLHMVALLGLVLAGSSFLLGLIVFVRRLLLGTVAPGWASLVIVVAFFNGFLFLMLSIVGEYVIRLQQQLSVPKPYAISTIAGRGR